MLQTIYLLLLLQMFMNVLPKSTNAFPTNLDSGGLIDRITRQALTSNIVTEDVCLTPACIQTAAEVLGNMDLTSNPCDNFYRFACGGYLKSTVVPNDEQHISTTKEIKYKIMDQLRVSLEEKSPPNELKTFSLVKNLYKACMNKKAIENQGLSGMHKILEELGGWPVLQGVKWKNDEKFRWEDASVKLKEKGYSPNFFLHFKVDVKKENKQQRIIHLEPAIVGFPPEFLTESNDEAVVKKNPYYKFMVDIAVIFGADRKRAEIELLDSFKFEKKLAIISNLEEVSIDNNQKNKNFYSMKIVALAQEFPSIKWKHYINQLLYASNIQIDDNEIVVVKSLKFIAELEVLMEKTPKRSQANYVMWRVVMNSLRYLNEEVRERRMLYFSKINKKADVELRLPMCLESAERMSISMKALYVRKYFNSWDKQTVMKIASNIQNQLGKILRNADWMENKTKELALNKVESLSQNIAYPDEYLDDSKLEAFYKDLEITGESYLESFLNLTDFERKFSYGGLRKTVNSSDWTFHMMKQTSGGVYIKAENSMHIFSEILQGVFFNSSRPSYMNYGGIGFYIGHKMTHGFDNFAIVTKKRAHFSDENYAIKPSKIFCLASHYMNYTSNSFRLLQTIGEYNQAENIADNGGIKLAYSAYKEWSEKNPPERRLPGLNFTPNQMFWMSFANTFCSKFPEEYIEDFHYDNVYSTDEVRVLGSLSNMPEFAQDFKCPSGSKMAPKKKCQVW